MEFIVAHPVYEGMPDAFSAPGRIQWEAPSNRPSGRFKQTHGRRLQWWARKAGELGISTSSAKWISRVAKQIHPTKKKPCKICGRVLELRYVYPGPKFLARVKKLPFVTDDFKVDRLEPVTALVSRLVENYGGKALKALPRLFSATKVPLPAPLPTDLDDWLQWIDQVFVAAEPRLLSPGAMSNAPDRFDGFHSDNLCCRSKSDKGRHKQNLRSYVTDRRTFEHWADGDWVAADRLMGHVRSTFHEERCRHGHPGPCSADHIGPISLGFTHRPRFQLLCRPCNSAKNNRMYLSDVTLLKADEQNGQRVISWHSQALWDACKSRVSSDEEARRLSKLLRDNRHCLMNSLWEIAKSGALAFLATLLELQRADGDIDFVNLRIEDHLTVFDRVQRTARTTKYAATQKARRCRVAFTELFEYFEKDNRNAFVIRTATSDRFLAAAIAKLQEVSRITARIDQAIAQALSSDPIEADAAFRKLLAELEKLRLDQFSEAFQLLRAHMDAVASELASRWNDDRYVRHLGDGDEAEDVESLPEA